MSPRLRFAHEDLGTGWFAHEDLGTGWFAHEDLDTGWFAHEDLAWGYPGVAAQGERLVLVL